MTRILLVEDEESYSDPLTYQLEREGFDVVTAATGPEALSKFEELGADLVLLDLMLPGLPGTEVCRRLRLVSDVPVIMLTAKDGEHDEADALDVGADDYLTKPFSFVVLVARLRALLRRGAPQRPAVLTAGDLSLDPATRRVARGDVEIELTAREFSLLEYLLRRQGEVVSKTELLAHVWDAHLDTDLNLVEVYVGYLRRKVDAPFGRSSLQTVRGAGYRLEG